MNRILVIDDEGQILGFVQAVLTHFEYEVKTAQNGETGIELFNKTMDFDMVITDIRMPGISGNAVATHIRNSEKPKTPIIAMSGYGGEIKRMLFDAALIKPFKLEDFLDVINSVKQRLSERKQVLG
jgi:DNA-binding response OmpR family regulator